MEHWGSIVRDMKDSEKQYGIEAYQTERMAREILDYVRYTRIRQYTLFIQKRGEEYEIMINKLKKNFAEEAIQRMMENEEFWKATQEMAEQ
jgi:ubiquinone/menaquinone biosynthesis C-methylase UbiE